MPKKLSRLLSPFAALVVLTTLACSDDKKPTAPTEPPEPPEMVTSRFNGLVPQRGESCNFFTLGADGSITSELKELKPLLSLTVGLALGTPSESDAQGCGRVVTDSSVRVFEVFLSANNVAGDYCICVFDVGNIFPDETISYVLDVTHPK